MNKNNLNLSIVQDESLFYKKLGSNIAHFRKKFGFTQLDIGRRIGVSHQQIQKYEAGKGSIYIHTVNIIANLFKISMDELVNYDSEKTESQDNGISKITINASRFARDGESEES